MEKENYFGKMELMGKRYSYPLVTTYAKKFIANRFVLIGDAAVGMHPVTAQVFNLNLKGLEILIKEIRAAVERKIDFVLYSVLQKYQSRLRRVATPIYLATNGIVNLYTNNTLPAKFVRPFLLRFISIIKPVKRTFLHALK